MSNDEDLSKSIKRIVEEELQTHRDAVRESIQMAVRDAVHEANSVIIADLNNRKPEGSRGRTWDVLQILLTAAVGFAVFWSQNRVSSRLDADKAELSTTLALTEEFQKKRFQAYDAAFAKLKDVEDAVFLLQTDSSVKAKTKAIDSLAEWNTLVKKNGLYLTDKAQDVSLNVWSDGLDIEYLNGTTKGQTFSHAVQTAKDEMKSEVTVYSKLPQTPPP